MDDRLTIYLDEHSIRAGNIEKVKRSLDPIVDSSTMVRRYEARVSLVFGAPGERRLGFFEMEKRLSSPLHKRWFRTLDAEISVLPYFLADDEGRSSLLLFLMGVLDYRIQKNRIVFDPTGADRFFKDKKSLIQNFCLSHNIDPTPSIKRLAGILCPGGDGKRRMIETGPEQVPLFPTSAPEETTASPSDASPTAPAPSDTASGTTVAETPKAEDAHPLRGLLDRFGSVAVFKENRMTKLFLVFDDIPAQIHFLDNKFVYDPSRGQWHFRTRFRTEGGERVIESLLLYRDDEVADSIRRYGGVLLVCIHRNAEGEYQKLFELDEPVPTTIVQEVAPMPEPAAEEPPQPAAPAAEQPPEERPPVAEAAPEPAVPRVEMPAEDPRDRRIAELEAEVVRLKKLVESYEESLVKKQRFGIFRKFFG